MRCRFLVLFLNPTTKTDAMRFSELSLVKHRVRLGAPLPFNVRAADETLLLARGQVIADSEQLGALMSRGALVDIAELGDMRLDVEAAAPSQLPQLWTQCLNKVGDVLMSAEGESFREALEDAVEPVQQLIRRDPDLAVFQVVQQQAGESLAYGVKRSLQSAVTSFLVARRLGWSVDESGRALKAALTMNLSMLELQGVLAQQCTPVTPDQRAGIRSHPLRSVQILERAGVTDPDWLAAVAQHHEEQDGSGYPSGRTDVHELAALLHRADVYTAKLSPRANRDAIAADRAGRQMFMQDPGHPMTAALVKEFGVYPPGCHVRLASGETAIVLKRGTTITTPTVVALSDTAGQSYPHPIRRDTARPGYGIEGVLGSARASARESAERLLPLVMA